MKRCIVAITLLCAFSAGAADIVRDRQSDCPAGLKWQDATHLKRMTRVGGTVTVAEITKYSDATVSRLETEGGAGTVIWLAGEKYPGNIQLSLGKDALHPFDLAELGTIVETPMMDGLWRRFTNPCSIEAAREILFDESDLSPNVDGGTKYKIHGRLLRHGTSVHYWATLEDLSPSGRGVEKWEGVWEYTPGKNPLPADTDFRGWGVYIQNNYLATFPIDEAVPLSSVLERVAKLRSGQ
jgi:hypothetical protein